jgi:hypothetical protein
MRDGDTRAEWSTHFARTVADELRSGVSSGALTWGEADELLARLRVLVDQALDLAPQLG